MLELPTARVCDLQSAEAARSKDELDAAIGRQLPSPPEACRSS